jgi:hypothetical protein
MTKIQRLEHAIKELTPDELAAFRRWFQEYDSEVWDSQIEQDAATDPILQPARRRTRLGAVGEKLAEKALKNNGFQQVCNLNKLRRNQPFADLLAEENGQRYFIGVKTRNEDKDCGGLNESYNCVLVSDKKNALLKSQGKSPQEITQIALQRVEKLASDFDAIPAWVAVPVRAHEGTYAVYFGTVAQLGCKRSIPMTHRERRDYRCLVKEWTADKRITPDLTNQRP